MSKFDTKEDLLATMQLLMDRLAMGTLTMDEMEDLVASSRAFYERTLILRYKSYEQEVYGSELSTDMTTVKESYQSNVSSIEVNETPTEMIENEKEKSAAFDLSFSLFDQLEIEEDCQGTIVDIMKSLCLKDDTASVSDGMEDDNDVNDVDDDDNTHELVPDVIDLSHDDDHISDEEEDEKILFSMEDLSITTIQTSNNTSESADSCLLLLKTVQDDEFQKDLNILDEKILKVKKIIDSMKNS